MNDTKQFQLIGINYLRTHRFLLQLENELLLLFFKYYSL